MKYNVCVITGTRAEFGLLQPLLVKMNKDEMINLQLAVTGSHLSAAFGNTQTEIEESGLPIYSRVPVNMDGDTKADMAISTGETISAFARYFKENRADLVVVLGDRYEAFAASTAAALEGIPIAHIYGGETTEGAVDEFLRHSITKMSYLHFTACGEYRNRVIQLGEAPTRVFDVGALGVENIVKIPAMTREGLSESLSFDLDGKYSIVTFHPVTQEENTSEEQLRQLIAAMDQFVDMKYVITKANADAGGRVINDIWDEEAKNRSNWLVVASLGARRYLSALKYSQMMIGNSSSGIVEAPAMHITSINIGDRQKGRMMADSVICCKPNTTDIALAMKNALSTKFKKIAKEAKSPFGDGSTSDKILYEIKRFLTSDKRDTKKAFYDIKIED